MKKFRAKGSKKAEYLEKKQYEYIKREFRDREDLRMEIVCSLLWGCIRIGDVLGTLTVGHFYKNGGTVKEGCEITEQKRGKKRIFKIRGTYLEGLLKKYWDTVKNSPKAAPMFYTQKTREPLKDSGVKKLFRDFIGHRGIDQVSPHSFRKGACRYLYYEKNETLDRIKDMLGHSSVKTTQIYCCINEKDIQNTQNLLFE